MNILVLDTNFMSLEMIDVYESFIWTDRYSKCGDFEFYAKATSELIDLLKPDRYLSIPYSDKLMIVEDIDITSDEEDGDHLKVTGRSLESILDRRIVWTQTNFNGNLQNGVKKLIDDAIIAPSISSRKISNFIFIDSTDPLVTKLTMDVQYTGDNLYDVISELCASNKIGFSITLNESNIFEFRLYAGMDRGYEQDKVPYVIFSPQFDNIENSEYIYSLKTLKNVTLIGGEGEGNERRFATVGDSSGLSRRELFTDARDISSNTDSGTIPSSDYIKLLQERGNKNLKENKLTEKFDGEAELTEMFVYGVDYFLGDVVDIANTYGNEAKTRITEIIISSDEKGLSIYPTFDVVDDEEE